MLYPREDRQAGTLAFQCRHCAYTEEVGPACIYRNELSNTVGETSGVTQDVASDPTVGDSDPSLPGFCTCCGQELVCETCGDVLDDGTYLEVEDCYGDGADARKETGGNEKKDLPMR